MVTVIEIPRKEDGIIRRIDGNILLYGRRKVGKTYLVKKKMRYDVYMLVKRGGSIHMEGGALREVDSYSQFKEMLESIIKEGKTAVVDEFQRLPDDFLDFISALDGPGRLVLTGSSFHLLRRSFLRGLRFSVCFPR